jgi:hypothetical protein
MTIDFSKANAHTEFIERIMNFYNNHFVVYTFLRNDLMLPTTTDK